VSKVSRAWVSSSATLPTSRNSLSIPARASAAGFHTSKTFFTDDEGVYLLDNRDSPACADRAPDGWPDFAAAVEAVKMRIKKVRDDRFGVPPEVPYVEARNTWVANQPGTSNSEKLVANALHI
jgi:hypothetical protein